jgi:sigma-B regulation protein RsbU (phosphoserine phosphatase)
LWAPLKTQNNVLGGVLLARLSGQSIFTASDEKLLMALARQAAVSADNTRLHNEMVEQARLKRELQLARDVQASLIPRNIPRVLNYDFAAYWQPAKEVGGDFYDFIRREKRQMGLVIGDVSDKGMHAALFMALTRSTIRASTLGAHTPMLGLNRANRLLCADSTGGMFVTLFYSQLDPVKNELTYVNAGHNPPLLYRAAEHKLVELTRTGILLGFDDTHEYGQLTVQLQPGDFVFCYTDGVTESVNIQNEQYGEERLYQLLLDHPDASPDDLLKTLLQSLSAFVGEASQFDDVTVLIAKRMV